MNVKTRPETNKDYAEIEKIHLQAFKGESEGKLVEALRNSDLFIPDLSIVAEDEVGSILGHILVSKVWIQADEIKHETLALAPMAISSSYQNKGIGSILVKKAIESAKNLGFKHMIVLGHSNFYPKFGFIPSVHKGITPPFPVPEDVFMVLELEPNSLINHSGQVIYPPSFASVT